MNISSFDKIVIAFFEDESCHNILKELTSQGFFCKALRSEGGFFKKPKSTILIGVNHDKLQSLLSLLEKHGNHTEKEYRPITVGADHSFPYFFTDTMEISVSHGGVEAFVFDIGQSKKY